MENKEIDFIMSLLITERNDAMTSIIKQFPGLHLTIPQMTETFIFTKLAEYEFRLRQLESINKPIK